MNLRRFNLLLLLLGIALGATVALLLTRSGEGVERSKGDDLAGLTRAASAEVQAFLGIDHAQVDAQTQTVLDGATGDFERQYAAGLESLKASARNQESTAVATVLEVGIGEVDLGADAGRGRATVLVAANTQVTSKATDGQVRTVPWRISLDMVREDGRWLTSGLRFVG